MMEKDDKLIGKIRQELDRSLIELDAVTCSRLNQARHRAMTQPRKSRLPWMYWGAVPAAAALVLVLALNLSTPQQMAPAVSQPGDLNILMATEPLEFYQEEIEFYEWLSKEFSIDEELPAGGLSSASVGGYDAGTAGRISGVTKLGVARVSGGV